MKIITISRQYGAGGREIGLAVGKELGVTLYDRDIIAATAKASSIAASDLTSFFLLLCMGTSFLYFTVIYP